MSGTHVVMLVANDVTNDTRVLKEAVALGAAGYQVTLLGVSASGRTAIDTIEGGVVIIRLSGRFPLRDERNRRRRVRRGRRLLSGRALSAGTARLAARSADLVADSGHALVRRSTGAVGPVRHQVGRAVRYVKRRRLLAMRTMLTFGGWLAELESQKATELWDRWDDWLTARTGRVNWRSVIPEADDYEAIFADLLDGLVPDVLHAHDMHVIGVASRAAARAAARGRTVKVVYDAHEYVAGLSQYGGRTPRLIAAWAQHEREFIRTADRVITVSPAIARQLRVEHRLDREPTVVINSPQPSADTGGITDVRAAAGVPEGVPLLVYSGGVTRARGVETAIAALQMLPDAHLAVVCVPHTRTKPVDELRHLAAALGVEDRVHYLAPVPTGAVVHFLRTADIGLIPILRYPSHEMALPNKVFEYTFAGLPVVTSDMPTLEEFVGKTGIGEVFPAENAAGLAAAVRRVLLDAASYRQRVSDPGLLEQMSWETQAGHLLRMYAELVGKPSESDVLAPNLVVGPTGTDVAKKWIAELGIGYLRPRLAPADLRGVTHLLIEDWQSVLSGEEPALDLPLLAAARVKHAVVVYGRADRDLVRRRMRTYDGTVFVTDRVVADAVAGTQWLPAGPQGVDVLRAFLSNR